MTTNNTNLVKMDVLDYTTGVKLGTIERSQAYDQQYADCQHPAFEWPNGVAAAADVLTDDELEQLGIDGNKTIWLD